MAGYLDLESSSPPDTTGTPDTGGVRRKFNKDAKMNKLKCPAGKIRDRSGNCIIDVGLAKQTKLEVQDAMNLT